MQDVLFHSTTIAVFAVLIVLVLGLYSMLKGTSPNTSQKLMRWRVGLQFFAILVIIAYVLYART
jgi:Hypoxia induced protein conserved region